MATTSNMGLDLPDSGVTTVGVAGTKLVTALGDIDSHDHSTGKGVKVTPAGMNINTAIDMSNNDITSASSTSFIAIGSALSGASHANKITSVNGEFFFTDGNGVAVQITSAGGLDVSGIGGWTGDYSSTVATAAYTDSTKVFKLLQDGSANHAGILDIGDIKLRTTTAGVTNYVTIKSPTLGSSWTLTLPGTAPASTQMLSLSATGVMSASSVVTATAGTFSSTLGVTGASTLGVVTGTSFNGVDPSSLAARHITGGADEIDGDKLDIDYTPTYYTPSTSPTEATSLANLTAHLDGIDNALSTLSAGGGTDHGTLAGLGDDDHTQYLLANGTRNFTGTLGGTALTLSSTLGVTGASTLGVVNASGLITANGGVTAGTGDDITVVGTGDFKHGDRTLWLSPTSTVSSRSDIFSASSSIDGVPIQLPVGTRIRSVSANVKDGTSTVLQFKLYETSANLNDTDLTTLTSTSSAGSGTAQTITMSTPIVVVDTAYYWLQVEVVSGTQIVYNYGYKVIYDNL